MTDSIATLLKQAELQKLQLQISHQFQKNIALFEDRFPEIAAKFKSHKSIHVDLKLDADGRLNLFHKQKNMFVYTMCPAEFCDRQVEQFKTSPYINRIRIGKSKAYNDRHIHIRYLNDLVGQYEQERNGHVFSTEGIMTNLVLTGVGLGYQIPKLIKDLEIYNLFVYENNLDIFYACLHTIDWAPILEYFSQSGHSITFCLGVKPDRALNQIEKAVDHIGLHNHIYTFIYKHTNIPEEEEFLQYYVKQIYAAMSGLGYYDDEQIGLAHTISNIKSKLPIFVSAKNPHIQLPPAVIVGNGPSLDMHEDFLRKNQDNAVFFSCGTSFGSLLKFGLKSDFHTEMERTISMKDLLDFSSTEEDRKGITLLCLNPVSPAVIESFDDACLALKPNDVGEDLIAEYYHPQKMLKLPFSNPTVSNCALSFAISMGFSEIYLVGVDLALTDLGQHHSSNSPHYDLEEHIEDIKEAIYTYSEGNFDTRANFGGRVKTHSTLNRARLSLERLIHYTKLAYPGFRCYNSNNGAYIEGTTAINVDNIRTFQAVDKGEAIAKIKDNNFYFSANKTYLKKDSKKILKHFFSIKDALKMNSSIRSERDFYNEAQRIYAIIDKNNDTIAHMLLRGSINSFLGTITENVMYSKDNASFVSQVNKGIKSYNSFIDHVYENMKNEPFRLDDTHNATLHRLKHEKEHAAKNHPS